MESTIWSVRTNCVVMLDFKVQYKLYTGCTQCATPQCATLSPMCNFFLRNLCFAPCPRCATLRKNFKSKMTKMNRNGLNRVFKMIKLTFKAVVYILYKNILPLFPINWPLFFKMGKKGLFFIKNFISIFPGQCPQCATMSPMCNTFLGSLGVAHWGTTG